MLEEDFPSLYNDKLFDESMCWICKINNELVGCIGINFLNNVINIEYFYVKNNYRKQGIGSKLMDIILSWISQNKKGQIIKLITLKDIMNDAINLYLKYGFKIIKFEKVPCYELVFMELIF